MALIVLFTCFAYSICANQIRRFLNGPIVVSLEKDYRNWVYEPMAITICTDFLNKSAMHEIIQRYANTEEDCDPDSYELYRQYFDLIRSLSSENLHLISEFEHTDLFANLTGEDLLSIAIEVCQIIFATILIIFIYLFDMPCAVKTTCFMGFSISICYD